MSSAGGTSKNLIMKGILISKFFKNILNIYTKILFLQEISPSNSNDFLTLSD